MILPELPVQLVLRERPAWRGEPVAVVEGERPESRVTHLNREAQKRGLRRGMRQAVARQLVPDVRATVVSEAALRRLVDDLTHALRTFSPRVERAAIDAFLLDAGGLDLLFGDAGNWARTIAAYLRGRDFVASIAVGFSRAHTLALARARRGIAVVPDAEEERELAAELRLAEIGMSAELADALGMLGVHTLGEFLALPAGEVASRLGPEAAAFHGRFADDPQLPIQPEPSMLTPRVELELASPDDRLEPLLFAARAPIDELLAMLDRRGEALRALALTLCLEPRQDASHDRIGLTVVPSEPTRDARVLLDLLRLRLEGVSFPSPIERLIFEAEGARPEAHQASLGSDAKPRDLAAGGRALARLRAAFGEQAVTRAVLRDAHLPEARFSYEPVREIAARAQPATPKTLAPLVRRVLARPRPLPPRERLDPARGPTVVEEGEVRLLGRPTRFSGGWLHREITRDYAYAETEAGSLLWVFYDPERGGWYLHGYVD